MLRNRKKLQDSVEQRLIKIKEGAEKHKKAVRERCESLRKSIDCIEYSLVGQINAMFKEDTTKLEKQLVDITSNEEQIRHQLASCRNIFTHSSDVELLISFRDFPDVSSYDIPHIVLPGEIEFIKSNTALRSLNDFIGVINRKSNLTLTSKTDLTVEETTEMIKIGSRVKRGRDWKCGNRVRFYLYSFSWLKVIYCIHINHRNVLNIISISLHLLFWVFVKLDLICLGFDKLLGIGSKRKIRRKSYVSIGSRTSDPLLSNLAL